MPREQWNADLTLHTICCYDLDMCNCFTDRRPDYLFDASRPEALLVACRTEGSGIERHQYLKETVAVAGECKGFLYRAAHWLAWWTERRHEWKMIRSSEFARQTVKRDISISQTLQFCNFAGHKKSNVLTVFGQQIKVIELCLLSNLVKKEIKRLKADIRPL